MFLPQPRFFVLLTAALVTACASPSIPPSTFRPDSVGVAVACAETGSDVDRDGISDECELEFARNFAPALRVRSGGCNWDASVVPARLGGGYLFGVDSLSAHGVRILYLPAYFLDCGWSGPKCWLPFVDCDPHPGDSEFIVVDVVRASDGPEWRVAAIFLSAHCFGRSGSDCRWYQEAELAAFNWVGRRQGGPPVIWVAEGRQANYPSWTACDRGHTAIDTCDHHDLEYRYPIAGHEQNIGSAAVPAGGGGGCRTPREIGSESAKVIADDRECIWDPATPFGGWQGGDPAAGATSYARYLDQISGVAGRPSS